MNLHLKVKEVFEEIELLNESEEICGVAKMVQLKNMLFCIIILDERNKTVDFYNFFSFEEMMNFKNEKFEFHAIN